MFFYFRFDIAGIYVVMFMHILKTLVQVLLVFFFLIVAFALAFTVLMQNEVGKNIGPNMRIFNAISHPYPKKNQNHYTRGITPKRVMSVGVHLRGLAPGNTAPKKHRSCGESLATLRPI